MDDSSNGRAVALYAADPGSNLRSDSVWDHFVSATLMSDDLTGLCLYIYIFSLFLSEIQAIFQYRGIFKQ